jgi:hypothetical protein
MDTISLPLTQQMFTTQFVGKEMVLARNILPSIRIEKVGQIVFGNDSYAGDLEGSLSIEGGQLVMTDQWKKPIYNFRGAETRNGSIFLVGEPHLEAHFAGFARCLLYEYKPLADFRICISTHKDYFADTMPRLLRSLDRAKMPKEKVLVVVGGSDENSETTTDGYQTILIKGNHDGLTALTALPQDYDGYWLLLHDTCEVMDDFMAKMAKLDVGLNLDLLVVAEDIGLYSSSLIKRLVAQKVFDKNAAAVIIFSYCLLWAESVAKSRHVSTKDVYGTGTKRQVLYLDDIGVKKYRRAKGAPAKP